MAATCSRCGQTLGLARWMLHKSLCEACQREVDQEERARAGQEGPTGGGSVSVSAPLFRLKNGEIATAVINAAAQRSLWGA
jgi:hypothetical protein